MKTTRRLASHDDNHEDEDENEDDDEENKRPKNIPVTVSTRSRGVRVCVSVYAASTERKDISALVPVFANSAAQFRIRIGT